MTVKELIEGLSGLNQDREITFYSYIETGRGGSWIEVKDFELEDDGENDNYRLCISGDEDEDGGYD